MRGRIVKNISTSLLVLFLSLLLVSCGGSDDKKDAANSVGDKEGPASAPRATAPDGLLVGEASYNLSIVCSEAKEIVSITGSGLDPATQTHTCAGSEAEDFSLSIKEGVSHPSPNELTISSEDEHGNPASGTTTVNVPIDRLAPSISIRNDGDIIEGGNASFEISVEDDHIAEGLNYAYAVSADRGTASASPNMCTANPCRVNVSGALRGSLTLTVAASAVTDDAGNSNTAEVNDSLTVGASTLSLGSVPIGTSLNAATYTVSGTCVAGQGDVKVTVGAVTDDVSCGGNPGSYTVSLDITGITTNPMTVEALQSDNRVFETRVNDRAGPASAPTATAPD